MPTYCLDPLHPSILRCELCGQVLGQPDRPGAIGCECLTAAQARTWWPELAGQVNEHECRHGGKRTEGGPDRA